MAAASTLPAPAVSEPKPRPQPVTGDNVYTLAMSGKRAGKLQKTFHLAEALACCSFWPVRRIDRLIDAVRANRYAPGVEELPCTGPMQLGDEAYGRLAELLHELWQLGPAEVAKWLRVVRVIHYRPRLRGPLLRIDPPAEPTESIPEQPAAAS